MTQKKPAQPTMHLIATALGLALASVVGVTAWQGLQTCAFLDRALGRSGCEGVVTIRDFRLLVGSGGYAPLPSVIRHGDEEARLFGWSQISTADDAAAEKPSMIAVDMASGSELFRTEMPVPQNAESSYWEAILLNDGQSAAICDYSSCPSTTEAEASGRLISLDDGAEGDKVTLPKTLYPNVFVDGPGRHHSADVPEWMADDNANVRAGSRDAASFQLGDHEVLFSPASSAEIALVASDGARITLIEPGTTAEPLFFVSPSGRFLLIVDRRPRDHAAWIFDSLHGALVHRVEALGIRSVLSAAWRVDETGFYLLRQDGRTLFMKRFGLPDLDLENRS